MTGQFLPSRYGRHLSFLHRPNPSHNLLHVEEHDSGEWSLSVQNKGAKKKKWLEISVIYDVSEEIQDSFGFPLLYHVTGLENSSHFLNQSDVKQKLIVDWSHVFPALDDACVFSLWALIGCSWILPFIWLTVVIILILVYDTPSESALSEKFTCTALSRQTLPGYYTPASGNFFFPSTRLLTT